MQFNALCVFVQLSVNHQLQRSNWGGKGLIRCLVFSTECSTGRSLQTEGSLSGGPTSANYFSHNLKGTFEYQCVLNFWGRQLDNDMGNKKLGSSLGYYGPLC